MLLLGSGNFKILCCSDQFFLLLLESFEDGCQIFTRIQDPSIDVISSVVCFSQLLFKFGKLVFQEFQILEGFLNFNCLGLNFFLGVLDDFFAGGDFILSCCNLIIDSFDDLLSSIDLSSLIVDFVGDVVGILT